MRDGTEVKMDAEKLEPLISECVQRVARQDKPDAILLLCTGNLPAYDVPVPVLGPQDAVRSYFEEKKGIKLVVISPEERQVGPAIARWDGVGGSVILGGTMATHGLTNVMVYMDCMGYTLEHKRSVEKITKDMVDEVVVPREVVFRAVGRLFGEDM